MSDDTVQRVKELAADVKELRDLAHGIAVVQARTTAGRQAQTVERLADVLWRELLDLRLGREEACLCSGGQVAPSCPVHGIVA